MSDDDFLRFCQSNPHLDFERDADGTIVLTAPTAGGSSRRNFRLYPPLNIWIEDSGIGGEGFESSGGFTLPNGAVRSPDMAWVSEGRLQTLSDEDWNRFLPLAPDFVVELRSHSDRLGDLTKKMAEYVENGVRLGWLIDPKTRRVHVYRPGAEPEVLEAPDSVDASPELPGFVLDLAPIWNPRRRRESFDPE